MEFKEFLNTNKEVIDESAQLKLDLISQITKMLGTAEISALKRCAKLLEGPFDVNEATCNIHNADGERAHTTTDKVITNKTLTLLNKKTPGHTLHKNGKPVKDESKE